MNGYHQLGTSSQKRQDRGNSPLRHKEQLQKPTASIRHAQPRNYDDEDEEYERRRSEELRKHMQQPKEYESSNGKPLRLNFNTNDMYTSGKSYQSIPEREVTQSHFTLGPQHNQDSAGGGYDIVPPHVKEHISNIQSDNSSLMRRLNLVIQELDRVNREKEDFILRLKQSAKESNELQKIINEEDNVDKVNKYMSDDLIYERDRNHKIKQQIKELDLYRNELIGELRKIQDRQDDIAKDNQQLTYSLQQKLSQIQDLEKEHYFTNEKIKQLNNAIESLKGELLEENTDKLELQRILNQLIQDRNELLGRLEHLTRKYDECVREISQDRAEMESHNKQHAKLITAKIIFQQLEQIQKARLLGAYQEFQSYCQFDSKCHNKLNGFAKILEKIGNFKLRRALRNWYGNGLKPLQIRQQSKLLAQQVSNQHLRFKMFIAWHALYQKKIKSYDLKTNAIQLIFQLQAKDKSIELKRSFQIWKECLDTFRLRKTRVKKLIWKLYFNKMSQAFNSWLNHSGNLDLQVRLNLLSKEFSQKQYLTILFNNFKYQVTETKRKRFNILFHCMKSWKDYLSYQKFIMSSNLVALHFKQNCNTSIIKQCFDALREHKEQEKFERVNGILNDEELPMIEQLQNQNEDFEVQRKFKEKTKACEAVKKMISKQLYGYFIHWKEMTDDYKEKLRTTIKDKIIKVYMEQIRKAFNYWKTLHDSNKMQSQQMIVEEFQAEQQALQNESIDLKKEIEQKQEQRDCTQQKHVLKCVTSFERRLKQIAMGRWRDQITQINVKEDGAGTIIKRLRLRFLRQAFDLYVAGVKFSKKIMSDEERCALYNRTRNERLLKEVVNAWIIFRDNHKKAKKYWYRMYLRLDIGMKQIAIKKWKEQTQRRVEKELLQKQNEVISNIENLNHHIGELHQAETDQNSQIKSMKDSMTTQARRIIANAFARFYYVSETRGFEKWKEFVIFEKNKERLFKKVIDHWRKYQFYNVKASFQNWILNSNIQERREQLKKEEMKVSDSQLQLEIQSKNFSSQKQKLENEMDQTKKLQDMYNKRLQKSVGMIINKVDGNHSMSQQRYILLKWREYVKREVQFIKCIQNVIQKSLWNKAFVEIRNFSRKTEGDTIKEDKLNMFRQKFWKRTCGNAFSVWRSGAFSMIAGTIEEVDSETNKTLTEYQDKKALFKEVNQNRSEKLLKKQHMHNLFQSWKNVTQLLKLQNSKDQHYQKSTDLFQKKMALFKWNSRKNATKLARLRMARLKQKFHQIRLRQYFYAFQTQFSNTKEFIKRISNLAKIHDHQGLQLSFNAIISFAKAKQFVHQNRKNNASKDLESILSSLISRRKHLYWRDLRLRTMNSKKQQMMKSFTILRNIANKMRTAFQKWKDISNERSLAKEMHEEGPVREEVFEARAVLKNLKNFMNDEGYDDKQIADALKQEKDRQAQLILRGLKRMQHYNEELYTKPKMFDRWRQFVHLRKLFKYWLGFAEKRGEYIKSDLHHAFDKWKTYLPAQEEALKKLNKSQLNKRTLKNNRALDQLSETVQDKENGLEHLNNQREALVETYVKSQKMALSLWMNYRKKCLHQGLIKWATTVREIKNREMLEMLRKNLELIENLKIKINTFESDNENIANENEELRQFSLDGYEIAKNVQALTAEREKLSVDLADKAQVIRKLLDENDKLTSKLRSAQDEAQTLIKSTMAGSSGFKTSKKDSSPLRQRSFY